MGFNLYLAGYSTSPFLVDIDIGTNCGLLFTFADGAKFVDRQLETFTSTKYFVDSGAYSIARSGRSVTIDDYVEYINSTDKPDIFASLDAIPFPELNAKTAIECSKKSWENYLYIVDRVPEKTKHKILPVYHFGEPREYLEKILSHKVLGEPVDYMALGGGNAGEYSKNKNYYTEVFNVIKNSPNPNVKVHAFGMTSIKLLEMFPFHSSDSTTWLKAAVNGGILWDTGKVISVSEQLKSQKNCYWNFDDAKQGVIRDVVEAKGFTMEDLATNYKSREIYNILFFKEWADNYQYKGLGTTRKRLF